MAAPQEAAMSEQAGVGYKRTPQATRFKKGTSGNPRGRPRGRHRAIPYDTLLGQMVTIREDGRVRRVTAAEAFMLQLTRKGLQGDSASARASLAAIETAQQRQGPQNPLKIIRVIFVSFGIGTVMGKLGLANKRHPLSEEKVRWELNPWIIEAALERMGDRQLTPDEQRIVWEAARMPDKVKWPEWWSYRGEG
jgi:hypothetical protein